MKIREGGDIGCYYTSPQSLIIIFSYSLAQNFDWLVNLVEFPNLSTTNSNKQKCNFVYHNWGCTPIYRPFLITLELDPCFPSRYFKILPPFAFSVTIIFLYKIRRLYMSSFKLGINSPRGESFPLVLSTLPQNTLFCFRFIFVYCSYMFKIQTTDAFGI